MAQKSAQSDQSTPLCLFVCHLFRRETVLRAAKVSDIVGPVLTLINSGQRAVQSRHPPASDCQNWLDLPGALQRLLLPVGARLYGQ